MAKTPQPGLLDIKGDLQLAQALMNVFKHMDLDWEGFIAQYLGDTVAYALSSVAKTSHRWLKQVFQARQQDVVVYLQDEIKWLPMPVIIEELYQEIDTTRTDVDRLEARLKRLQETITC